MSCNNMSLKGLQPNCDGSLGGIVKVYITPWADDLFTYDTTSASTGEVTAIKSGTTFYVYNFRKGSSSMSGTLNIDPSNGVQYTETLVNLTFSRMDTPKRIEMNSLALSDLAVIVLDSNQQRWVLGLTEPVVVQSGTLQSGQAKGDGNNYGLVLVDNQPNFPPKLADNVVLTTNEDQNNG